MRQQKERILEKYNVVLVTYSVAALSRPCPSFEFNCFYLKEKFAHLQAVRTHAENVKV